MPGLFRPKTEDAGLKPYRDDVANRVYNQLFCDDIEAYRSAALEQAYPWNTLLAKVKSRESLQAIVEDNVVECRAKIFAHRQLDPGEHYLYGAVVELALDKGLNVVAAYRDGSARGITPSGRISEQLDDEAGKLRESVVALLSAAQYVIGHIPPWNKARLPFPNRGLARFSILLSDGFYFGQAPMDKMMKDPLGEPMLEAAMALSVLL